MYGLVNIVNGHSRIGSSGDLWRRLLNYQQPGYLKAYPHLLIVRAILKHGISHFVIVILELTPRKNAYVIEQQLIDNAKPLYNIVLDIAGGRVNQGKNKTVSVWTPERRELQSLRQIGSRNTFYGIHHTVEAKAALRQHALTRTTPTKPTHKVEARDINTGITTFDTSLRKASEALNVSHTHRRKFNGRCYYNHHITIHKLARVDALGALFAFYLSPLFSFTFLKALVALIVSFLRVFF